MTDISIGIGLGIGPLVNTAMKLHALTHLLNINIFIFNFILPKVNTDYIKEAQVINIDN